jgi:cytochrome c biogenesis factor
MKTCFFTFTIWLLAAFINGVLYATVFSLGKLVNTDAAESFFLATIFSLVFSIPAIFCFWIVFLTNSEKENLSAVLLKTAFIVSALSCLIVPILPSDVVNGHHVLLVLMIVIAALTSVLLHHPVIKSFYHSKKESNV